MRERCQRTRKCSTSGPSARRRPSRGATRGSMILLHCGPQIPICLNIGLEHDCCASINSRRAACAGIYLKGELRLIASSVWIGSMQDSCIARHERSPWRNSGPHLPCLRGISRTRRLRGPDGDDQSSLRAATACNSLQGRIRTATRSQRSRAMPRPRQVACEPPTLEMDQCALRLVT